MFLFYLSFPGDSKRNNCSMVSKSGKLAFNMFASVTPVEMNECNGTCFMSSSVNACNATILQSNCQCCRPKFIEARVVKFKLNYPLLNFFFNVIISVTKSCECGPCGL